MSQLMTTANTPVLQPQSFDQLVRFAEMAAGSALMPRDYQGKPANVMIAVQMGSELGLAPMQSIQNIAVINGRPSVWGDAMIALVRASPVCDDVVETLEGDGDRLTAICVAKRKGKAPVEARFSVEDAKKANLWNKAGPWQQYPKRMLQMRARGFALRDAFPDVLKGLISAEEASDIPADDFKESVQRTQRLSQESRTIEHQPETRKIDYVKLMTAKAKQCQGVQDAIKLRSQWVATTAKAEEAGRPIPDDEQAQVYELIEARQDELAGAFATQNTEREEEIPA